MSFPPFLLGGLPTTAVNNITTMFLGDAVLPVSTASPSTLPAASVVLDAGSIASRQPCRDFDYPAADTPTAFTKAPCHYFVLSAAGKPVYASVGDDDEVAAYMGILSTLILFPPNGWDGMVTSNGTQFVVVDRDPLYLVAVSHQDTPRPVLARQLATLHSALVAMLTQLYISRVFAHRLNFDLRQSLSRKDTLVLDGLCVQWSRQSRANLPNLTQTLECLCLKARVRAKLDAMLLRLRECTPPVEDPPVHNSLLYALLVVSPGILVSICRPRSHSLHTSDLQLLFHMVFGPHTPPGELWLPVCLPKFNDSGFLYCYAGQVELEPTAPPLNVLLVSARKGAFFEMKQYRAVLQQSLQDLPKVKTALVEALKNAFVGTPPPVAGPSKAALIKHFVYVNKRQLQFVTSRWPQEETAQLNIARLHHRLKVAMDRNAGEVIRHSSIVGEASSEHDEPSQMVQCEWEVAPSTHVTGVAVGNSNFDIYALVPTGGSRGVRRDLVLQHLQVILKWCFKNEERLFVSRGGVF